MLFINWLIRIFKEWRRKRKIKKKLKELRKRDPFVYKH